MKMILIKIMICCLMMIIIKDESSIEEFSSDDDGVDKGSKCEQMMMKKKIISTLGLVIFSSTIVISKQEVASLDTNARSERRGNCCIFKLLFANRDGRKRGEKSLLFVDLFSSHQDDDDDSRGTTMQMIIENLISISERKIHKKKS